MMSDELITTVTTLMRSLQEQEEEYDANPNQVEGEGGVYSIDTVFGGDDDDYDDDYVFETWQFWLIVMVIAVFIAAVIFYCSYKHEICCGVHKAREDHGEADIENGKKLATKTFKDSTAFERLPDHVVDHHMNISSKQLEKLENGTETTSTSSLRSSNGNNNPTSASVIASTRSAAASSTTSCMRNSNMHSLVVAPRCVLCSKPFEIGENVTHSTACHHEFRESCLLRYWAKNKSMNGKCPVCKLEYVVEEVSPSKHFSESMHMPDASRRSHSAREIGPFEEIEEEQPQQGEEKTNKE